MEFREARSPKDFDCTVNDKEILAASEYEFNQRLGDMIQIIKESFVPVLTAHFQFTPLEEKRDILSAFFQCAQSLEKSGRGLEEGQKREYHMTVQTIFKQLYSQKMDEAERGDSDSNQDWLLIELVKFMLASEVSAFRPLVPPEQIQNLLAQLMKKRTESLSQFVSQEFMADLDQDELKKASDAEKKALRQADERLKRGAGRNLFDIEHHLKIACQMCQDVKLSMDMEKIQSLLQSAEQPGAAQNRAGMQKLRTEWQELLEKDLAGSKQKKQDGGKDAAAQDEMQIDTKEKLADPAPAERKKDEFVLITDWKAAGDNLAIYFDALLLFFRSLSKTAFSYHNQMGAYLNQIFVKAL